MKTTKTWRLVGGAALALALGGAPALAQDGDAQRAEREALARQLELLHRELAELQEDHLRRTQRADLERARLEAERERLRAELERVRAEVAEARRRGRAGAPPQGPEEQAIQQRLAGQQVTLNFNDTPFNDVIDFMRDITGINFVVTARAQECESELNLRLVGIRLEDALGLILQAGVTEMTYTVRNGAVVIDVVGE